MAQQVPPTPDPVPVSLEASTTALMVMDLVDPSRSSLQSYVAMMPRIISLIGRARAAGVFVAYTCGASGGEPVPEVGRGPGAPLIQGGQNKFFNTMLDDHLRTRGIRTVILTGWRANGSVLFTSHGATALRYTVVVPVDGVTAPHEFQVAIGLYQVLDLLNGNPTNEPLRKGTVTLSRTDLIQFT